MLPVQAWELDSARTDWAAVLLNVPAQHRRPTYVKTASAGQTRVYTVLAEVNCYLEPGYPGEPKDLKAADGQAAQTYWALSLPYTVAVQRDDQFVINDIAYEVVDTDASDDPDLTVEVVQLVRAQRLKGLAAIILTPNALVAGVSVQTATLTVG